MRRALTARSRRRPAGKREGGRGGEEATAPLSCSAARLFKLAVFKMRTSCVQRSCGCFSRAPAPCHAPQPLCARALSRSRNKRREAAERLWQQQAGWFGTVIGRAMESMNETVYGPVGGAGGGDDSAVGNRKRTVKWTRRERSDYTSSYDSEDEPRSQRVEAVRVAPGYSVPPELALVPLSSRDDAPRRRP